jgi:flagellar biosynthesis/type III secretory pathway protein FliH
VGRVLKFVHAQTTDVTPFGRDALEEFPDAPAYVLPAFQEEAPPEEVEMPLDPDVIREEIMAAARIDAEHKVKEAYQEGLARGTEAGRERFDATIAKSAEALQAAAEAIRESHEHFLNGLEPQVIGLVKALVTKVIDLEMSTHPDLLNHMVRRALDRMAGQFAVTLLVNPQDLEAIRAHEIALLDGIPGVESLQVVASEDVGPGGCIARSADLEIDARLESLLEQVLNALTE